MPDRVAALIIKNNKLLIITGYDESIWWTPGGKAESGEDHEKALRRELKEELDVDVDEMKKYDEKLVINSMTNKPQKVYFYIVKISGEIKPAAEITKFYWLSTIEAKAGKFKLSEVMTGYVIPKLIKDKLL